MMPSSAHPSPARSWPALAGFVLLALLIYWPARNAGFVMDWFGWQYAYDREGWAGVLGSFGYPGLHPVLHLANYTLYAVFHTGWGWYLVACTLHGLNAYLLYRLVERLPMQGAPGRQREWGLWAALLFALSPYAVEPVVWRVCLHYLLAYAFALLTLHRTLDFMETGRRRSWWYLQLFFLLGLFSIEWSVVVPLLAAVLVVVYSWAQGLRRAAAARLIQVSLPQLALLAGYFLLNKVVFGDWVGHYGAKTHLNIQPQAMLATAFKYAVKHLAMVRHYPHAWKTRIFDGLDAGWIFWAAFALAGILLLAWLLLFRRLGGRLRWAGASLVWFFLAVAPVSNLFFFHLQLSENDRYGYFASGFLWMAAVLALSHLPGILFRLLAGGLVVWSIVLAFGMTRLWGQAEAVFDGLVRDFRWYDRDEVIILASPDNMRGVFMFRIIGQPNGFHEPLELRRKEPYRGSMWEAVQFNMTGPADAIKAETDSTRQTFYIGFPQDGNWWWRNGLGGTDYENDRYTFRVKEWHAEVALREKRPNTAIIYPVGSRWVELETGY